MSKAKPVPIRFEEDEKLLLAELAKRTGLKAPEIIRRSLRMLNQEVQRRGSVGFILDLTSIDLETKPVSYLKAAEEPPSDDRGKKNRAPKKPTAADILAAKQTLLNAASKNARTPKH